MDGIEPLDPDSEKAPTPLPVNVDALPPTQYLILDVLAARHRLGEHMWTFPSRLASTMRHLEAAGLVSWKSGITAGTLRAWLTDTGRAACLLDGYEPAPVKAAREEEQKRIADLLWRHAHGAAATLVEESAP